MNTVCEQGALEEVAESQSRLPGSCFQKVDSAPQSATKATYRLQHSDFRFRVYKEGIRRPIQASFSLQHRSAHVECRHCLAYCWGVWQSGVQRSGVQQSTGELNAIREQKCFICSPFHGRACHWWEN